MSPRASLKTSSILLVYIHFHLKILISIATVIEPTVNETNVLAFKRKNNDADEERLKRCGLTTLEERRLSEDSIEAYKIVTK